MYADEEVFEREVDEDGAYESWRDAECEQANEELNDLILSIVIRKGYYYENKNKLMKHFKAMLEAELK